MILFLFIVFSYVLIGILLRIPISMALIVFEEHSSKIETLDDAYQVAKNTSPCNKFLTALFWPLGLFLIFAGLVFLLFIGFGFAIEYVGNRFGKYIP